MDQSTTKITFHSCRAWKISESTYMNSRRVWFCNTMFSVYSGMLLQQEGFIYTCTLYLIGIFKEVKEKCFVFKYMVLKGHSVVLDFDKWSYFWITLRIEEGSWTWKEQKVIIMIICICLNHQIHITQGFALQ